MSETGKWNLYWLCAGFLLCGVLRALLYGRDFSTGFSLLWCGLMVVAWGVSVRHRVTDRSLRRLLMGIAAMQALHIALQLFRFDPFNHLSGASLAVDRRLWYAFYVPMTAIPVLCVWAALLVNRPRPLSRLFWLLPAAAALLIVGVLTNDLHFAFVSFPSGFMLDDGREAIGWLHYAVNVFIYGTYIAALLIMVKKSLACSGQRYRWLPVIPLLAGILYGALYPLRIGHRLFGFRVWNIGEMLVFCLLGALESCIQTGLIPANTDYEKLFPLAGLSAAIVDSGGETRYASGPISYPFPEQASLRIERQLVPGGRVEWAVDISRLTALNEALEETARKLEARNAYLSQEAEIKAEKSELETRNAIYDHITRVVRPQLDRINALLDDADLPFEEKMRPITVMSAYIKRRSNMELTAENGLLPLNELFLAALETADVLRQCGVSAAASGGGGVRYPSELIIDAYEQIESVIENCFPTLSSLMISLQGNGDALTVRLMLVSETLTVPAQEPDAANRGFTRALSVTKDGKDVLLLYTYRPGGERA